MSKRTIAVLGCTGSVGLQALDVAEKQRYNVAAISCAKNIEKAEQVIRKHKVKLCGVEDGAAGSLLKAAVKDTDCRVVSGKGAAATVAECAEADTVLNSVTGIAGLMPTVKALQSGKSLALANKESLVTAGQYVMSLAKSNGKEILPVDSEHCAVWQSLKCGRRRDVKKIILTASGGPFFGYTPEQIADVTVEQALAHPTWKMGTKITIDSATLMNKGFEVIEAKWLFDAKPDQIEVIVHRESIIHSMVEYKDNMIIAQLGAPDMRSCIQYALTAPKRIDGVAQSLDFAKIAKMSFYEPDTKTFPLLAFAYEVLKLGGCYGAALNGANEAAVELFLNKKLNLPKLFDIVQSATLKAGTDDCSLEAVFEADARARATVYEKMH